ncbi:hypothetical protein PV387_15515 [Streptomyces sp. ME02-6987-2C]|uniref:hypothetical protein n=1 Tax=unclassified Streptomyces TaxID=2593676 RepID=UPI0008799AC2|nr:MULTISPECIES: hypothetical protein [unclassified Streptomyces]MDX3367428.1 hypothetical protein [Streptomyces sp. ME02-6987-2C]MDX3423756.1 hypothetical protein [Streptomyces sp. ME02-6985-2c]REH20654.1 hypothetical protein BX268_2438 [Streptomyces sp. 2221.1]SDT31405.1 hypothetical protein SAMN05428941_2433 [Streptomyces sp. 2114.2]
MHPTRTARDELPVTAPFTLASQAAVYEVRTLRTDADRAEAAALVQDRQRWLDQHGLRLTCPTDVPALFRNPQTRSAGLFEDGKLLACMIPERSPRLSWGEGPCLYLGHVHTLPDQPDDITRLITLWASDLAARLGLPLVRTETPARYALNAGPTAALLRRLTDMGWNVRGPGTGREGERAARLELGAEDRPGLSALIACRVHELMDGTDDRSGL